MLNYEKLKGFFAGLPVPWTENGDIDEKVFVDAINRLADAGVQGIYNGGGSGEFFAQDFNKFKKLTDLLTDTVKNKDVLTEAGISACSTEQVVERGLYAIKKGIDGLQVGFPFFFTVTDDEAVQFYKDLYNEFNGFPLIHYDTGLSGKPLDINLLEKICDVCPSLIGVKWATNNDIVAIEGFTSRFPKISFFAGPYFFTTYHELIGIRGVYDNLVYMNPRIILKLWDLCEQKKYKEAMKYQIIVNKVINIVVDLGLLNYTFGAIDRCLGIASGFLKGYSLKVKKPYKSVPESLLNDLKKRLKEEVPEFLIL